jgi:hypothetical protein
MRVEIVSVEVFVVLIELLLSLVVTPSGAPLTVSATVDPKPKRFVQRSPSSSSRTGRPWPRSPTA